MKVASILPLVLVILAILTHTVEQAESFSVSIKKPRKKRVFKNEGSLIESRKTGKDSASKRVAYEKETEQHGQMAEEVRRKGRRN